MIYYQWIGRADRRVEHLPLIRDFDVPKWTLQRCKVPFWRIARMKRWGWAIERNWLAYAVMTRWMDDRPLPSHVNCRCRLVEVAE